MEHDRRTFMKTAGLAGIAAMTTAAVSPAAAQSGTGQKRTEGDAEGHDLRDAAPG